MHQVNDNVAPLKETSLDEIKTSEAEEESHDTLDDLHTTEISEEHSVGDL